MSFFHFLVIGKFRSILSWITFFCTGHDLSIMAKFRSGYIPLAIVVGLIVFGVLASSTTVFMSADRKFQVNFLQEPNSRTIFTTFFYWYKADGSKLNETQHIEENWTQATIDQVNQDTYPAGWPGLENASQMVVPDNGNLIHDELSLHPPAQQPAYYPNGTVVPSSLKDGVLTNITSWFSYTDPAWYEWEMRGIMQAGVDVLMPDYWWNGINNAWAIQGLPHLNYSWYDLAQAMVNESQAPNLAAAEHMLPKIAMFFDTTCMKQLYIDDLSGGNTTLYNELWMNNNIKGPDLSNSTWEQCFWNCIKSFYQSFNDTNLFLFNNRYVVWLYSSGWFSNVGTTVLDYCQQQAMAMFGHYLYFVGDSGWEKATSDPAHTFGVCPWGAALNVIAAQPVGIPVGGYGPGYYDIGVIAGEGPIYKARNVANFISGLEQVINSGAAWIHIETWNEFHEGTGIAWSQEYGYTFINALRQVADQFHAMKGYNPVQNFQVPFIVTAITSLVVLVGVAVLMAKHADAR